MGHPLGPYQQQPFIQLEIPPEGLVRLMIVEIAQVMAEKRLLAAAQGKGALQLPPDGQERARGTARAIRSAAGRNRAIAARAVSSPATTRVTESSQRTWIGRSCTKKTSAMSASRLQCVVVTISNRFIRPIAAGHHQRHIADRVKQQVVQRRIGKHHTQARIARCNRLGNIAIAARPLGQQNDGTTRRDEQLAFQPIDLTEGHRHLEARDHHGQRLFIPMFAAPCSSATAVSLRASQTRW